MRTQFLNLEGNTEVKMVDEVIRQETFYQASWPGGVRATDIRAETSLSPLRGMLGPGSRRIVFWPSNTDSLSNDLRADLSSLRISAMVDAQGIVRAIEVIARDFFTKNKDQEKTKDWETFVYEKEWGRWFPIQQVNNMPVKSFCIRCHVSSDKHFSPLPNNIHDLSVFRKIGYKSDSLIQDLDTYRSKNGK